MTSAQNEQVLTLYEQHGVAEGEIASWLELDTSAVRLFLLSNSAKYRQEHSKKAKSHDDDMAAGAELVNGDFTESDFELAKQTILQCLSADRESVRIKAAQLIMDAKKGGKGLKGLGTLNLTMQNFNMMVTRAKEAKEMAMAKVVDASTRPALLDNE